MLAFLGASQNVAFVSAIVLMLLIGVVQLSGLIGDFDGDTDLDADAGLLGWLGFGRLPLMVLLVVWLGTFGSIGLVGQQVAIDAAGGMLSPWIAGPVAAILAFPTTGILVRLLAPILPRDHTTAIPLDMLVGNPGRILVGRATAGSPARARVEDHHGQTHYVMVEPNDPTQTLHEGEHVLLVARDDGLFRAISRGDHFLPTIGEPRR